MCCLKNLGITPPTAYSELTSGADERGKRYPDEG